MPAAKVTSKGQITIPVEVRKALGLKGGDRVDFYQNAEGEFVLAPKNRSIRELAGCVPKLDYVPTIEEMNRAIGAAVAANYLRGMDRSDADPAKDEAA